jgi:antitoxin HicB
VKYRVMIKQDEDGVFVAEVPSLPGCVTQGSTRSEALANAREAIAGYLESLRVHGEPIPDAASFPIPAAHRAELDRRLRDWEEHPEAGTSWEEVRGRLERRD